MGELAVYNYHKDNLTVSQEGLVMYKGSRFLVPTVLRPGLLRALHSGHAGVVSMLMRAKECFWWPGLKQAIEMCGQIVWFVMKMRHHSQNNLVWVF